MFEKSHIVAKTESIRSALKKLDLSGLKLVLVCEADFKLLGVATDGDLRRAILSGADLEEPIQNFYNPHPIVCIRDQYLETEARKLFLENKLTAIPILDCPGGKVVEVLSWDNLFKEEVRPFYDGPPIETQVVIMAGGKGTRLAPFTTVLPKPLIPIGEKTILEIIIEEFSKFKIDTYFLTLNYRSEIIKAYFDSLPHKKYTLSYLHEEEFLGTAGCLRDLKNKLTGTFFVSNCDIIVKADFSEVVKFHRSSDAAITVVSSIQSHIVPYGVIDFGSGGNVTGIREKPEFTFPINTGVYVLEPRCLDYIPEKSQFHMTQLIEKLIAMGEKVVTFPVNEKEYIDLGQWDVYRKALAILQT